MSRPYRLVVFDWEGTLGDTLGQIIHTIALVSKRMQLGDFDEVLARRSVDLGLGLAIKKLFPDLSMHQHEVLLQELQHELTHHLSDICLIPGAKRVVEQLQLAGVHLAIATNKGSHSLQRALQTTGLQPYFQVTRSAGQVAPKPCPQMMEEIMAAFEMTPKDTLMIGDSVSDMEMARLAGVCAIGVDFYHQQAEILLSFGALEVFDDYQQLAKYLQLP
ncbi:MAG: HAD-IA family hydrolase [Legionellales bacterium]|nr:HAD-IA family hydrolase [Legionellales bacterium]